MRQFPVSKHEYHQEQILIKEEQSAYYAKKIFGRSRWSVAD